MYAHDIVEQVSKHYRLSLDNDGQFVVTDTRTWLLVFIGDSAALVHWAEVMNR